MYEELETGCGRGIRPRKPGPADDMRMCLSRSRGACRPSHPATGPGLSPLPASESSGCGSPSPQGGSTPGKFQRSQELDRIIDVVERSANNRPEAGSGMKSSSFSFWQSLPNTARHWHGTDLRLGDKTRDFYPNYRSRLPTSRRL